MRWLRVSKSSGHLNHVEGSHHGVIVRYRAQKGAPASSVVNGKNWHMSDVCPQNTLGLGHVAGGQRSEDLPVLGQRAARTPRASGPGLPCRRGSGEAGRVGRGSTAFAFVPRRSAPRGNADRPRSLPVNIPLPGAARTLRWPAPSRPGPAWRRRNLLDRKALQGEAKLGDLGKVLDRQRGDKVSRPLPALDHPLRFQPGEGLAQRRPVHPQALSPLRLAQPLPRLDLLKNQQPAKRPISKVSLGGQIVGGKFRH